MKYFDAILKLLNAVHQVNQVIKPLQSFLICLAVFMFVKVNGIGIQGFALCYFLYCWWMRFEKLFLLVLHCVVSSSQCYFHFYVFNLDHNGGNWKSIPSTRVVLDFYYVEGMLVESIISPVA